MVRLFASAGFVLILAACGGSSATVDEAERDDSGRIVGAGRVGTQALRAADCFVEPEDASVVSVTGVPCSRTHDGQVVARVVATDTAEWPGPAALSEDAASRCRAAAEAVLSTSVLGTAIGLSAYVPDDGSWRAGDRDIVCFVESAGASRLDGDLFVGTT